MSEPSGRAAYMQEADEDDNAREDAPKVTASIAPSSPTKSRGHSPNTSRSRRPGSVSPPGPLTDEGSISSDGGSTAHPKGSRRKSSSKEVARLSPKKVTVDPSPKPPLSRQSRTSPTVHTHSSSWRPANDPANYGRETDRGGAPLIMPHQSSRPRARTDDPSRRHSSYYTPHNSRPPLANARFSSLYPPATQVFPPPQGWMQAPPPPPQVQSAMPPPPPPRQAGMFVMPLANRFERGMERPERPLSAMAQRPHRYEEYERPEDRHVSRRPSQRKREQSRDRMPPPPPRREPPPQPPQRPSSAVPTGGRREIPLRPGPFAPPAAPPPPPPQTVRAERRGSRVYDENPFTPDPISPYYVPADTSPIMVYDPPPRTRRPSVGAATIALNDNAALYRTDVAAGAAAAHNHRRHSYYGYEDKMQAARDYQDTAGGGDNNSHTPLTAENVRRATRTRHHGGSSQSTRSSASRDESDFKQSATTRTTRSSIPIVDDDVTIRVKGAANVKVAGADINVSSEGAEIHVMRNGVPLVSAAAAAAVTSAGTIRGLVGGGSSDQSSYIDDDERRARRERFTGMRQRSNSTYGPRTTAGMMGGGGPPPPFITDYPVDPAALVLDRAGGYFAPPHPYSSVYHRNMI